MRLLPRGHRYQHGILGTIQAPSQHRPLPKWRQIQILRCKFFYLGTSLDRPEYVKIKLADIPQEFVDEYDLTKYARNGWLYFEIS